MFTKAAHIKPNTKKAHHPAFNRVQQNDSFIPAIQPKLQVDSPSSTYEAEADRMADFVVSNGSYALPTNIVSSAPVQTSSEPIGTQVRELDAGELADEVMPPMPGEDPKVSNENAEPETNVEEEKIEKEEPEVVDEVVKEAEPTKEAEKGGSTPAPKVEKEEEVAAQQDEGEKVSSEETALFSKEGKPDPVSPLPITSELTNQFVQTKSDEGAQSEEEQEIQEEQEEKIHTKLFDEEGGASEDNSIQRSGDGAPQVSSKTEQGIAASKSGGHSMDGKTQQFMESQFQADFSDVKVHSDNNASNLNNQLRAKAFTHENHVYFNEGQYDPGSREGQHLIAHELTHVVQQDASIQRKPQISNAPAPKVQRLGISDALDYFADKANHIPGFRMFTIIIGVNPINMRSVDRSAANIMRAMVEFLPGGFLITQALDNHGVFDKASVWFKEQLDTLSITGSSIKDAVDDFLDSLGWSDIFDLGGVWNRAVAIFTRPIKRLISFASGLVSTIIEMVKSAILRPLAGLAEGTPAYDLLRVVLGSDPITGDPYPPTAENLIGGFMKLIGQEEIWKNIQEGNAIEKAYAWFQNALSGLMGFVTALPTTFIDTLKSLTWTDIVLLPKAFIKVGKVFLNVAGKFLEWAGGTVLSLLEIIFTVVAPGAVPWIKKAGAAFNKIIEDPIGFLGNLLKAAKDGFLKFSENIGKHLKAALINWLTGSLAGAGIYIPTGLNFQEIIKFVLSVLGISWANIRIKLVKHLGEPAVKALETGFELVTLLVTKGPMAMWERIMEHISDLKTMVMGEITSWVITKVVTKAITKLVSSLNPAGAVIQAILFVYDTITFLVDKIKKIAQVGFAVLDSIVNIANGVLGAAIQKVEQTFAGMLTLAINFLAHFLGLGKVSEKVVEIINKLKEKVDKAIDKVIEWLVTTAKNFLKGIFGLGGKEDSPLKDDGEIGAKVSFSAGNEGHKMWVDQSSLKLRVASEESDVAPKLAQWKDMLKNMDDAKKAEGQPLISSAEAELAKAEKEAKETKDATDAASTNASPAAVASVNENDDQTEAAENALAPIMAKLFDFFEGGKPFEPIADPIPLSGGSETLNITSKSGSPKLEIKVGSTEIRSAINGLRSGPISTAKHAHGGTFVQSLITAAEPTVNAIETIVITNGNIKSTDKDKVKGQASSIVEVLKPIGTKLKIGSFARASKAESMAVFAITFAQKMGNNPDLLTEYNRQLKAQEAGLNKLSIDQWQLNRNAYTLDDDRFESIDKEQRRTVLTELKKRADDAAGRSTRGKQKYLDAATALDEAMNNLDTDGYEPKFDKITPVTGRFGNESSWRRHNKKGIKNIKTEVRKQSDDWSDLFKRVAVLHNADQIAGGFGEINKITVPPTPGDGGSLAEWKTYLSNIEEYVGSVRVNSSIGSLWKDNIVKLESHVQSTYSDPASWSLWNLNVDLS